MLETWSHPDTWVSLATLSALEIVLGIDNVVFLSILAAKLPPARQPLARRLGLGLALGTRLLLLLAVTWLMGLTRVLFHLLGHGFTGRDLILAGGGLFLIAKATFEIHDKLEVRHEARPAPGGAGAFGLVLLQIAVLDVVFSLDSVITAVGMARHFSVMVAAMVIAVAVMMAFAGAIGAFVERHPTMKMLALAFLLLIGVMLVAEGTGRHIERGYVYFAMAFSLGVELLNMRMRRAMAAPVALHNRFDGEASAAPPASPPPPLAPPPAPAPPPASAPPAGPAAGAR
ncbi:MAG TPA: TerC family protein [Anaeromyxobacteraceae bacterium]|nr:TerC family protein [Anaeromyxobacteraceae bacterium]